MLEKLRNFIIEKLTTKINKDFDDSAKYQAEFGETRELAVQNALSQKSKAMEKSFEVLEKRGYIQAEIQSLLYEIKPLQDKANELKQELNFAKNYILEYMQQSEELQEIEIDGYLYKVEKTEAIRQELDKDMILNDFETSELVALNIVKSTFDKKKFIDTHKLDVVKRYAKEHVLSKTVLREEILNGEE
ncbi:MAG: hypothetical protein FWE02_03730 [Defluviitaleaceae bacterium]|nr:hypothetical protein [Defluviitaleaceae bacterium]